MSPSGRYVGGYTVSIAADDSFLKSPTIIDLETGETYQSGPYPEGVYFLTQTMCISDQGLLFIVDGNQGGTFVCDLEGNITKFGGGGGIPRQTHHTGNFGRRQVLGRLCA